MQSKQWLQSEAFLYRLSDDPRPSNTDLVQVTMAEGTTDHARRAQLASQLLALLNKAHKQPTAWVYLMDSQELRVSLTDPDSPDHEFGKNEFSIPFQEEHVSATVNTVRNVLERLGVEVKVSV